jgi:hypothetical protein
MKKAMITLICLFAMLAAGSVLKAQEAVLELYPGWTWISYPSTDTLDFATVFDSFTPMTGDYIKSQMGYAEYYEGYGWFGSLTNFMPCKGFMYKSNRTEPVMITVGTPLSQQAVTTMEPSDITAESAVVGGTVTLGEGNHIFARGVCWGTEPLPNVDGSHTIDATVTGSQTVTLDNLTPNTTYYVRAYVATDNGLSYGEVLNFTTLEDGSTGNIPTGAIDGKFTINNDGDQVYFSQGNLQYIGSVSQPYWKFADNQWDYLGNNGQASTDQNVDRDLFGWGTSGHNHGAVCYQPWSTSTSCSDYYAYGSYTYNLYDQTGEADWGCNPISNGGNIPNTWRTLTMDEWLYVFNTRNTTSGIRYVKAKVNSVNGLILLPDDWNTIYHTLNSINPTGNCDFNVNVISYSDWVSDFQAHGAVFLPAAGFRDGTAVCSGNDGDYWSATSVNDVYAGHEGFNNGDVYLGGGNFRNYGFSVRLVRTAELVTSYNIGAASNPSEGGTIIGIGNYELSATCILTAIANEGYTFENWTENGEVVSTDPSYAFTVNSNRFLVANFTYVLQSFTVTVTANPTDGGTITGGGNYQQGQSCTVTASANIGYTFTSWTEDGEVVSTDATYSFTIIGDRSLVANFAVSSSGEHGYVDLGLPSGTLWATCNVGANAPEEYGDYFAWGETQPKDTYNWNTYQYCNGSSSTLTKYCYDSAYGYNGFIDNLTTLLPEDDAATVNWGDDWRMPTMEEWQELFDNTTITGATQNGEHGRLFTASNGNSLFLPSAGHYDWNGLYDVNNGIYQSSSLGGYSNAAWVIKFEGNSCNMYSRLRYYGFSVRAVRSTSQNMSFVINAMASPTEGGSVSGGGTYQEGSDCMLTATANEGYTFSNWTENGEVVSTDATYSFTVDGNRNLVANFAVSSSGEHSYVDLGLPSGTLWATCNVGAETPEEYGDYFAWGETQPKDNYQWSTYQYCNGSSSTLTKYCSNSSFGYYGFTDNLTTLLPEDDAASTNWGGDWRMPTKEEWQELQNNTTSTWTIQNGVYGRLFTANNGNSLFLPAAGYYGDNILRGDGIWGYYWSNTLNTNYSHPDEARLFYFLSSSSNSNSNYRSFGCSVRPVQSASQLVINATANPTEGGSVSGGGVYPVGADCVLTATANEGYFFIKWTENGELVSSNAIYSFTVNSNRNLVANFGISVAHPYVDLGLPSGTLWATCNVGADAPYEYGDYFAWGEIQPKSDYGWNTYQFCNGSENTLTKYCSKANYGYNGFTDTLTTLLPENDAATVNWGGDWRMPTDEEWDELFDNTTRTWISMNGTIGILFTASNHNSIFLPAAGIYRYNHLEYAGSSGHYWSSSLSTDDPRFAGEFSYTSSNWFFTGYTSRCNGQSVRPVRSVLLK